MGFVLFGRLLFCGLAHVSRIYLHTVTTYLDSESLEYQVMAEDAIYKVRAYEMMGRARKFGKYEEDAGLDL